MTHFDRHGKALSEGKVRANPFRNNPELVTDPVFLIGNGKSRVNFDLERLRSKGTIIGCNALYRDFKPDILVCVDSKLIREVRDSDYDLENFCIIPYNRSVTLRTGYKYKTNRFNTSGCFAMKIISDVMFPEFCYMLGMDGFTGNIYDATLNYQKKTLTNFTGVVSHYLKALQASPETIFVNVNTQDAWPKEAHETDRYKFITYEEFEKTVLC